MTDLQIAEDPETSEDELGKLAFTDDPEVAVAVMKNPKTPEWAKRRLASRQEPHIQRALEMSGADMHENGGERLLTHSRTNASRIVVSTTELIPGYDIVEVVGPVFSTQSHTRWKNFDTKSGQDATSQSGRLSIALQGSLRAIREEAAGLGANAIVGLSMAANSSEGASALLGGSSDAIVLLGTAVKARRLPNAGRRIPCPTCAEEILVEAKRCRFCGETPLSAE